MNVTPSASVSADIPSTRLSMSQSHVTSFALAGKSENPQLRQYWRKRGVIKPQ